MRALTWRAAMAVVAVALVAGACGNSDGQAGDGDLPKLPLGAVGAGRSSATMSAEGAADSSAMLAPFRAVEYRLAEDADAVPETATAYEVKARPADEVRDKVAKALDVDRDRVEVGAGGYDWYFSGVSPDTAVSSSPACAPDETCIDEAPAPPPTVRGVPSAADAEARVKDILEALDASTEGDFEVFGEDGYNRTVVFTPEVDGRSVAGLQTQIAFGGEGRIEYASGLLAEVEPIGEYPLVGLDEAVKRLQEGFGSGGVRTMGAPEPAIATADEQPAAVDSATRDAAAAREEQTSDASGGTSTGSTGATSGGGSSGSTGSGSTEPGTAIAEPTPACAPGEPCSTPPSPPADEPTMTIEPDPAVPVEPTEPQVVEITGAELSLQIVAAGCPGDPVYLVPTFDLQSEAGPAGSVIAVEDDVIAGQGADGDDQELEPCPDQGVTDGPVGKPEPAPMPADTGREPANP